MPLDFSDSIKFDKEVKMENQEKLKTGIGNIEAEKLEAKPVKIVKVDLRTVQFGNKENEKVAFTVKHPDKEEEIEISSVKHEVANNLKETGLWFSTDKEGKIQKGSALANLLKFWKIENLEAAIGKEVETMMDSKGYLCFKAY